MLKKILVAKMYLRVVALLTALLVLPSAAAVDFVVNSTLDQPDTLTIPGTCHTAANTCTLRAAVMQANRTSGGGVATITVPAGLYKLTIPATGVASETSGDLDLLPPPFGSNPTIVIAGAGAPTTIIDAQQLDRVFHVYSGRTARISGVTIQNGFAGVGAGIRNDGVLALDSAKVYDNHGASAAGISSAGNLTITNSTIQLNIATAVAGGIYVNSTGVLVMTGSAISQNKSASGGGGIYSDGGPVTITSSTLDFNESAFGGGIYNFGSALTIANSTISQNNASISGGGIYNDLGQANVYNSTIFFNGADSNVDGLGLGGGVFNANTGATFNIRNTMMVGNYLSNSPTYQDCAGTIGTYGKNLFWDTTGCALPQPATTWTLLNSLSSLDTVLRNNGGPTLTHALLAGSNAIDGGDPVQGCLGPDANPLPTDQRGFARIVGARCDIGAFEYNPARIDADGNGAYDALTDGLLILRYLFGLTGTALTNGAIGPQATRTTPTAIAQYLDGIRPQLDVDANTQTDALTDGLMLIRYLFGLRGAALTAGAIGPNANRTGAQIEAYIQSLMP